MIRYTRIKVDKVDNKYIMSWYDCSELKRKQKSFNSLSQAKKKEAELYALNECSDNECTEHFERNLERKLQLNNLLLRDLIDEYYSDRKKENLSIAHYQNIKNILEQMFNIIGNIKLVDLKIYNLWQQITVPKHIKQYGSHRLLMLKRTIQCFLKWCVIKKYCSSELLDEMLHMQINVYQKQQKTNAISIEQFELLNQQIPINKQCFFAIMFYAALRPSEVLALEVQNIDKQNHKLYVERALTKHQQENGTRYSIHHLKHRAPGDYRIIPINKKLQSYLYSYIEDTDEKDMLYTPGWKYEQYWKQAVAATLTPLEQKRLALRPYDLRHACVSRWLKNGIDPARVAQLAGHTVDVLLKTYAHVIDDRNDDYLEKMD